MQLVVADASPVRYLIQIQYIYLLHTLFEKIFMPSVVVDELTHPSAPVEVRKWFQNLPEWVHVSHVTVTDDPMLQGLDSGELSAIALGVSLKADLILIDDRKGAAAALQKGFTVTGTLGILDLAARRNLLQLSEAIQRLKATNFRYKPEILEALLVQYQKAGND